MICENCNCDTYVIHIIESHKKVCPQCYGRKIKKDVVISQLLSMRKKKPLNMPKEAVKILLGTKRLMK